MEIKDKLKAIQEKLGTATSGLKKSFVEENAFSKKLDLNFKTIRVFAIAGILIFVTTVFLLPTDLPVEFTEKIEHSETKAEESANAADSGQKTESAQALWGAPKVAIPGGGGGSQVNHNTSMIVGMAGGNAKT